MELAERVHITLEELPYCLFMVNFLLCLMDPFRVMSVMVQLSNAIITHPQFLSWKHLIEQERHHSQVPLSPATIDLKNSLIRVDKLLPRIEWAVELSRRGDAVLREGLIKLSGVEVSLPGAEYSKRITNSLRPLLSKGD